jgi:hypothetical protein
MATSHLGILIWENFLPRRGNAFVIIQGPPDAGRQIAETEMLGGFSSSECDPGGLAEAAGAFSITHANA